MPRKLPRYCVEDVDRYGKTRIYLRRVGHPKIRLEGNPWTPDFMRSYADALDGVITTKPTDRYEIKPGTWRDLCIKYFGSAHFGTLDEATRKRRRSSLENTFTEPLKPGSSITYADFPVVRMTPEAIALLRDRKAALPEGANNLLKAIRGVFKWANDSQVKLATDDPAKAVQRLRIVSDGHHTWTEVEVNRYIDRHPPGTKAYLALCLLLYGGGRRSDVVVFGPEHIQIRDGQQWLVYTHHKGRNSNPMRVEVPILPELATALITCPTGNQTFLITDKGKPFTSNGFGNKVKDWCVEAGLPHCNCHGLRKAGATLAAESGATINQMMAIFGWRTTDMAELYTRKASRRNLAKGGIGHLKFVRTSVQQSDPSDSELDNSEK